MQLCYFLPSRLRLPHHLPSLFVSRCLHFASAAFPLGTHPSDFSLICTSPPARLVVVHLHISKAVQPLFATLDARLTFQLLRHCSPQWSLIGPCTPSARSLNQRNCPTTASVQIVNQTSRVRGDRRALKKNKSRRCPKTRTANHSVGSCRQLLTCSRSAMYSRSGASTSLGP